MTVGLVSVVAALTLVPALLGLLGDGVNALRIPFLGRAVDSAGKEGRFWSRIARAVMRRPVVSLVASVVVLLAAAAPVLDLRLSQPGLRSFPDDGPVKGGVPRARGGVRRRNGRLGARRRRGRRRFVAAASGRRADSSASSSRTRHSDSPRSRSARIEQAALVEALVVGDSRDAHAIDAVEQLRRATVPEVFGDLTHGSS